MVSWCIPVTPTVPWIAAYTGNRNKFNTISYLSSTLKPTQQASCFFNVKKAAILIWQLSFPCTTLQNYVPLLTLETVFLSSASMMGHHTAGMFTVVIALQVSDLSTCFFGLKGSTHSHTPSHVSYYAGLWGLFYIKYHSHEQFRNSNPPHLQVFGLWEETRATEVNPGALCLYMHLFWNGWYRQ